MAEIAASRKADKRHAVEDAMSEALIRKCPKCAKPYIKDSGCNKIRVSLPPPGLADDSASSANQPRAISANRSLKDTITLRIIDHQVNEPLRHVDCGITRKRPRMPPTFFAPETQLYLHRLNALPPRVSPLMLKISLSKLPCPLYLLQSTTPTSDYSARWDQCRGRSTQITSGIFRYRPTIVDRSPTSMVFPISPVDQITQSAPTHLFQHIGKFPMFQHPSHIPPVVSRIYNRSETHPSALTYLSAHTHQTIFELGWLGIPTTTLHSIQVDKLSSTNSKERGNDLES